MNKTLIYAGVAGIIAFLVSCFSQSDIVRIIHGISSIIFLWGYKIIGERAELKLLKNVSIAFILWCIGSLLLAFTDFLGHSFLFIMLYFVGLYGVLGILFGAAILPLREEIGNIARIAGILGIIVGVCFVLIGIQPILMELGLDSNILGAGYGTWLLFPVYFLEVIIIFKATRLDKFK